MLRGLITFLLLGASLLAGHSLLTRSKVLYKEDSFTLTPAEVDTVVVVIAPKPITITIAPPGGSERPKFPVGSTIFFVSLTNFPVTMAAAGGATLVSRDDSMKVSSFGSRWEIIYLGYNLWLLSGDLTTTEYDGYLGDSIVLKAKVDLKATGPFTFVWRKNGDIIDGANKASLGITSLQASDAGIYLVTVSNSAGLVSSEVLTLNVR